METTPLDGYKKISVTLLTVLLSIILLFVHTQTTADTVTNVFTQLENWIPALLGIVYTLVQGSVDKEKAGQLAEPRPPLRTHSPKANSASVAQPAVAQVVQAAADVEVYTPVDLDKYVATAEEGIRKDGQTVTPLTKAYLFLAGHYPLRSAPHPPAVPHQRRQAHCR